MVVAFYIDGFDLGFLSMTPESWKGDSREEAREEKRGEIE